MQRAVPAAAFERAEAPQGALARTAADGAAGLFLQAGGVVRQGRDQKRVWTSSDGTTENPVQVSCTPNT